MRPGHTQSVQVLGMEFVWTGEYSCDGKSNFSPTGEYGKSICREGHDQNCKDKLDKSEMKSP
jgi:hypothetical protein